MNSLQDLNGYSNSAIVYQTTATGNVVISTPVNLAFEMPDFTNRWSWPVGIEMLQTGNVGNTNFYTISMPIDPGLANVAQAVTWPNLPNTFSITRSGYTANTGTYDYQIKGPMTTTNWNLVKSPVIQLGNLFNFSNQVMTANVYINAGNTASHTVTLSFPFDVDNPSQSYTEDVLSNINTFSVSSTQVNKIYQVNIQQNPVVGNIILGNTSYGGQITLTGNKTNVNASLANLQFLGNANGSANTTLFYSQQQVTNGVQQARAYPVPLNSTGDLFDTVISGGFRLLDAAGNYTSTANVSSTDFYYNKFPYFEVQGNGVSGTGNTVSNVNVAFNIPGSIESTGIYRIGNVVTITPNAFSTGVRYQNYYAMIGFVDPGPGTAEEDYSALVTATTTGSQTSTRTFTARKFSDSAEIDSTQPGYVFTGGAYKQGRQGAFLYTVDLPRVLTGNRFTLSSNSSIALNNRHYPDFGFQTKTLAVAVVRITRDGNSGQDINYNLSSNTFSPALNASNQAFWQSLNINIGIGNTTILNKANGTNTITTVNTVANVTSLVSATAWNTPQVTNIPIALSLGNVSTAYFNTDTDEWISLSMNITPTSISSNLQYGPNFAPQPGNGTPRRFQSSWTRI